MEQTYRGKCHRGRVTFTLKSPPITRGKRCNCSICRRRGSTMSELDTDALPIDRVDGASYPLD